MNDNKINSKEILKGIKKDNKAFCTNEKLLHQRSLGKNKKKKIYIYTHTL